MQFGQPTLTVDDAENPTDVICIGAPSGPGAVSFVVFDAGTKPEAVTGQLGDSLLAFSLATHVRLRLIALPGGDAGAGIPTDAEYFAISSIVVTGRLECNGHANSVTGSSPTSCQCQHSTTGANCEQCLPTHQHSAFQRGTSFASGACTVCQCNGHASTCAYDARLDSGVCESCGEHTDGGNCDTCDDGFFRAEGTPITQTDACQPCASCNPDGTVAAVCVKDTFDSASLAPGTCLCKAEWTGPNCGSCKQGFHAVGGQCEACGCHAVGSTQTGCNTAGECSCRPNVSGDKCDSCSAGFFSIGDGCIACGCDTATTIGGDPTCHPATGQCACADGYSGLQCSQCAVGFFRDAASGMCTACGCNAAEASSTACDAQGVCACLPDSPFGGAKCDECKAGTTAQGTGCKPCDCNAAGALAADLCEASSGLCNCKERVEGAKCDMCKAGFAGLDQQDELGCSGGEAHV